MKKRIFSMFLAMCMVFTTIPTVAYATVPTMPVICENHKEHNKACGYMEEREAEPCGHKTDEGYDCEITDDEATPSDADEGTPSNGKRAYVCDHKDGCGYRKAVQGKPCRHTCDLCAPQPVCDCTVICTPADEENQSEAVIKADCPVCGGENADLTNCKGAAAIPLLNAKGITAGITADAIWNDGDIIEGVNTVLTIDASQSPITVTVEGTVAVNCNILVTGSNTVTFSGGGILQRGSGYEGNMLEINSGVVLDGITLDGNKEAVVAQAAIVRVASNGTLTMKGDTFIQNNKNSNSGNSAGGVYLIGTFHMEGGTITGNEAINYGAGVYANGTFHMSGGTITGNIANYNAQEEVSPDGSGGGVYFQGKEISMSGTASITGNTIAVKDAGEKPNNICLAIGKNVTILKDWTGEAGVNSLASTYPVTVSSNSVTSDQAARITSDQMEYIAYLDSSFNTVKLKANDKLIIQRLYFESDSADCDCTTYPYIDNYTHTHNGAPCFTWKKETKTLTLNSLDLAGDIILENIDTVTVDINGTCTIKENSSHGIQASGSMTLTGDGTLLVRGNDKDDNFPNSHGIFCGGTLTFNHTGNITAIGGSKGAEDRHGIYTTKDINFNSGTLSASGGIATKNSAGICASGSFNLSGGSVTAIGANAENSYGLYGDTGINVTGGMLEAKCATGTKISQAVNVPPKAGAGMVLSVTGSEDVDGQLGEVTDLDTGFAKYKHLKFEPQPASDGYDPGDVAVVNEIIKTNGLQATQNDPAGWAAEWLVVWDDSSPRRITTLSINDKKLTGKLDVTGLTNLIQLRCADSQLTSLAVSGLSYLTSITCYNNQLEELNVSGLTELKSVKCYNNRLTELDLSGLTKMVSLLCYDNQLVTLNLSGLTNLMDINCDNNRLTNLDASASTALSVLSCNSNPITSLNMPGGRELTVESAAGGSVQLTRFVSYEPTMSLEAIAQSGYTFEKWIAEGTTLADNTANPLSFALNGKVKLTPVYKMHPDIAAVTQAKSAIEGGTYTMAQADATTKEAVKAALVSLINALDGMSDTGITVTADNIEVTGFTSATVGTDGSFEFTVALSKGEAAGTTSSKSGVIKSKVIDPQAIISLEEFQAAVDGATGDLSVKLADGYTANGKGTLTIQGTIQNLTIDLNGQTMDGGTGNAAILHYSAGDLTINDTGTEGKITSANNENLYNRSTIFISNTDNKNSSIIINSGTIENTESAAIHLYDNSSSGRSYVVEVNGGTIIGKMLGIRLSGTDELKTNGGMVKSISQFSTTVVLWEKSTATICDGTVLNEGNGGKAIKNNGTGIITLSGGTIIANNTTGLAGGTAIESPADTVKILGSTDPDSAVTLMGTHVMTNPPDLTSYPDVRIMGDKTSLTGSAAVEIFAADIDTAVEVESYQYLQFKKKETVPLIFSDSSSYDIPASVIGTGIPNIDVSGGVSGGTLPYEYSAAGLPDGITIDSATGIINGTPTTASTTGGTAAITVTDSTAAGKQTGTIEIGYGVISEKPAKEPTPTAVFTATGRDKGILSGVTSGMKYKAIGYDWIDISSADDISLTNIAPGAIRIVKKGTGTTNDSDEQSISVTQAATPSGLGITNETQEGNDGTITGVSSAMEYLKNGVGDHIDITGTTLNHLSSGTYLIRVKAAGTVLASYYKIMIIAAYEKNTPTAADLTYSLAAVTFDGSAKPADVKKATSAIGDLTVKYNGSATAPVNAGTYKITVEIAASSTYNAANLILGDYTVNQAAAPEVSDNKTSVIFNDSTGKSHALTGAPANMGLTSYVSENVIDSKHILESSAVDAKGTVTYQLKSTLTAADAGATATIPITVTSQNYTPIHIKVVVTVSNKTDVSNSITFGNGTAAYNGGIQLHEAATITGQAGGNWTYTYTTTDGTLENGKPKGAGTYHVTATYTDSTAMGSKSASFTISKKEATVRADNQSMTKNGALPVFTVSYTGFLGSDTQDNVLSTKAVAITTADGKTNGSFDITFGTKAALGDTAGKNYTLTHVNGILTVSGGSGGNTGGSGGSSSQTSTAKPSAENPNLPTPGEIKAETTVDSDGKATVNITDQNLTDALNQAQADAEKKGNQAGGIDLVLNVKTGSGLGDGNTASSASINLPKTVQETIINRQILNTIVVIDHPSISIRMNLDAVKEINTQAKADVNITSTRTDNRQLTGTAKSAIGSRPVFDLKVRYGSGKTVQNFGAGSVAVSIPYTLASGETAGNVQAVSIDSDGNAAWLTNSVYDSLNKVLRFNTNHFSTYGVGYRTGVSELGDTASHWAKDDISFAVNRGLIAGTTAAAFSPDTAITRSAYITALGRLAGVDQNRYGASSFGDVSNDAGYKGYIEWAAGTGILSGINSMGEGKFAPDAPVTREEMAIMMSNYAKAPGVTLPKVHEEIHFADEAQIGETYRAAVKQLQMAGIVSSKNNNIYDPKGEATRAQAAAMLRRYTGITISIDTAQGWRMNDSGQWLYYENGRQIERQMQ